MTRTVGEGAFEIAYQPISALATAKLSHYEALARFANSEGTQDTVKFIEALGIANVFDLAVASKVLGLIEQHSDVHVAFEAIADFERFGAFDEGGDEAVVDAGLNVDAVGGDTGLAGVAELGEERAFDGAG